VIEIRAILFLITFFTMKSKRVIMKAPFILLLMPQPPKLFVFQQPDFSSSLFHAPTNVPNDVDQSVKPEQPKQW
jgi:hypothetical protein